MSIIGKGRAYKPGDHFIEYGGKRLRFETEEARDEAHAFMEHVQKEAARVAHNLAANQNISFQEQLADHIEQCEAVLSNLKQQ